MANTLRTPLTYSKAWVSNQGLETIPAAVDSESEARANLQVQHTEAKEKINEIVGAITTSISTFNDDEHIPTAKAVRSIIVQSDWEETDARTNSYIQHKPTLATVATTGSYNDLTDTPTPPTIPTVSGTTGKIAKFTGANAVGDAFTLTISSSSPTGGSDGDIWIKYEV